jgi:hypothetical protein
MVESKNVEIIFAEFGPNRGDHGGVKFGNDRLDPSYHTFKKYFPNASIKVYTDIPDNFKKYAELDSKFSIKKIDISNYEFLNNNHPRAGYRCSDYFRVVGMLESNYEYAIYTDSDMFVCSHDVTQGILLSDTYGLCVPANPRLLFEKDIILGVDAPESNTEIFKKGINYTKMHSFNAAPLFFSTKHVNARSMLEKYCQLFEKNPMRGPSCLNLASITSKYFPCLLPFQWCVSRDNIQDEVILHVGKQQVAQKYFSGE